MDEFDERSRFHHSSAGVPAGTSDQYHQQWTQAFAAARNDVVGNLVHQRHGTLQARANDLVDRVQVRTDQHADLLEAECRDVLRDSGVLES